MPIDQVLDLRKELGDESMRDLLGHVSVRRPGEIAVQVDAVVRRKAAERFKGVGVRYRHDEQRPFEPGRIEFGQTFVDATTQEVFLFAPSRRDAETPDTGSGLGVTPLSGPFASHSLNIVRVDGGSTYRLRDTTHPRDILTFDLAHDAFWTDWEIKYGIHNGTLPVSQDTEGDTHH